MRAEDTHESRSSASSLWALCALLLATTNALGQGSTTGTIRGTIQDSSGGVLPGATVTLTNTGTKAMQTAVSDGRGQYILSGIFPGTYDLKVELSGFKTYEQKAIAISPTDNRGIDVRLEVGQQSETVTVTSQVGDPPDRDGRARRPHHCQADREPVGHRPQRPRADAHPPRRRHRVQHGRVGELRRRRQQHAGLYGQRHPRRRATRSRSTDRSLIDIGSNSGVIVSLNNDMVQEVKVQSSNFAAEHGTGGMNISGVTKSGTSKFHGSLYDYWRDHRFAANDRSNSIAGTEKPKSTLSVSRRQHRRPDHVRRQLHEEPRSAVLLRRLRGAAAAGGLRVALHAHLHRGDEERRFQRAARQSRVEPEQRAAAAHPAGLPERGRAGAEQRHAAVRQRHRPLLREPVSERRTTSTRRTFTTTSTASSNRRTATTSRAGSTGRSATTPAPTSGSPTRARRSRARAASGGRRPTSSRCRRRTSARTSGRSYAGNVVSVLSPTMTNEVLVSFSRLEARQSLQGSEHPHAGRRRHQLPRDLPRRGVEPVSADGHAPRLGRQRPGRQLVGEGERHVRAQRRAPVQQQVDEARRRARPEVRRLRRAGPEAAELPEPRSRRAVVRHRQRHRHRQLGGGHARRAASASSRRAPRATATRRPGSPPANGGTGTSMRSRRTAGSSART